jgi:hypothetical protein
MTAWRQAIELSIGDEDVARLVSITRSRTEPASRVDRARMLLAYRENASFFAVAHALGVHHQTVQAAKKGPLRGSLKSRSTVSIAPFMGDEISGHPPFPAQIMLNGHEYVACQARKAGIIFTKQGNCFTHVSRPAALAKIAETLSEPRTIARRAFG